jgi:hypothetical protein
MVQNDLLIRIWRERIQDFFSRIMINSLKRMTEPPDSAVVIFNISMSRSLKNKFPKYEDNLKCLVSFTQYVI